LVSNSLTAVALRYRRPILIRRESPGKSNSAPATSIKPAGISEAATYGLTFILGVYVGFFSGGYVALLRAVLYAFFGITFIEAVAVTKVLNLFSS
jgi:hypothetical protein